MNARELQSAAEFANANTFPRGSLHSTAELMVAYASERVAQLGAKISSLQKQNEELRYYSQNLDKYLKEQNDKIMAQSAVQKQVEGLRAALQEFVDNANWEKVPASEEEFDAMIVRAEAALATQLPTEKK